MCAPPSHPNVLQNPDDLKATMSMALALMMLQNYCIAQNQTSRDKLFKPCPAARSLCFLFCNKVSIYAVHPIDFII